MSARAGHREEQRVLRLLVAYDGAGFSGFQLQPGLRTVQGVLTEGLERLTDREVRLRGAGRTDAGVHALGQVVSVDDWTGPDADAVLRTMQAIMPKDVGIIDAQEGPEGFDARASANWRRYVYLLWNHPSSNPLVRGYTLWVRDPIDTDRLAEALATIRGEHDFSAFARVRPEQTPVRRVLDAGVSRHESLVRIEITANAFLHQMVRSIVGSAIEVGTGRRSIDWMGHALESRDRATAGRVAPPHGLTLVEVGYHEAPWPRATKPLWPFSEDMTTLLAGDRQ